MLEGDDDEDVESDADQPNERDEQQDGPRLDDGFYVLSCSCGASCRSTGAVRLRPFSPFRLTAREAALFRERVVEADDEDVYRVVDEILEPAKDPRRFDAFLRDHLAHGVTARLDTEDAWSVLPAGRERGEATEATFALQGAELPSRLQPRLTLSPPLRLAWSFDESPLPFPTPFEDCVLALGYDEATFCVNHDGSLRWQLPMHCRFPLADEAGRMVMFAERKTEDRWVLRAITVDRDAGTILGDAVASHTPVLGLPGRPSYIGREHQVVTSTGPTRTALALVALADEPRVLWEIVEPRDEFGGVGIGLPCTAEGRVFVERGRRFVCLELEDAREVWSVDLTPFGGPAGELHRLGPCRVGGLVIAPVRDGGLAAFDAASGSPAWQQEVRSPRSWVVCDSEIHLWEIEANADGPDTRWSVLDASSGRELRRWSAAEAVYGACGLRPSSMSCGPVIAEHHIYFGDLAGRMWAVERESGRPVWRHRPPGIESWPSNMPAVKGRRLYFGRLGDASLPGRMYCYEEC